MHTRNIYSSTIGTNNFHTLFKMLFSIVQQQNGYGNLIHSVTTYPDELIINRL
jgi:hypothetical protein